MPRVSVLMAHAGGTRFVREACKSLSRQHYSDFELVVIDDGANLDWQELLEGSTFSWRVSHNSRQQGLARSLNRGAEESSGELLARLDSDDVCAPSRLSAQVKLLERRGDVSFVGCAVRWMDGRGRIVGRGYPVTEPEDLRLALLGYNQLCHGSVLMRRQAYEALGGYDPSLQVAQDYDLWLRGLERGHGFANVPEALYDLRLHAGSVTAQAGTDQSTRAARLRATAVPLRAAALAEWFEAGRDRRLGRPHERLQLGKLAVVLAPWALRSARPKQRQQLLGWVLRQLPGIAELTVREMGWRHGTVAKLRHLMGPSE